MRKIWKWLTHEYVLFFVALILSIKLVFLGRSLGLNKSDWPAWVQAVGSVMAIVVAIIIAQEQHARDRKLDEQRRKEEQDGELDRQLLARALAVSNVVQVASHSLHAALTLVTRCKEDAAHWEREPYLNKMSQLAAVLNSLITPMTEHLAVLSALEISEILEQTRSDMSNLGGAMGPELLARSEKRINEGYDFLARLIGLKGRLDDMCRARGLPLEIEDFTPRA